VSEPEPATGVGVGRHYRGRLGEEYFEWQGESGELGARLNLFKFAPHVKPGDRVVDFGCGAGYLLEALEAQGKVGVEPSAPARAAALERGLEVVASAAELRDGEADVVVSNHALEHTLEPLSELRQLRRALRPGGLLVLWLPIDDWRAQRSPVAGDRNHHLYTWTPLLLRNLLEEAGFEVRECRVVAHAWPTRRYATLHRLLPKPLFELAAGAWSRLRKRRQLAALAVRPINGEGHHR
jgi:SAM-dependent methyltransferase